MAKLYTDRVPQQKPSPTEQQEIAKKRALEQTAQMAGGGANLPENAPASLGGTASADCAAGTPTGTDPAAAGEPAATDGPSSEPVGGSLGGNTSGIKPAVTSMIRKSIPAGCRAQVTPKGGQNVGGKTVTRKKKKSSHPGGYAADTALFCGSKRQGFGDKKFNEYIYNLNQNGARGLAAYRQGFVHADLGSPHQRRWSGDGADKDYTNRAAGGQDPGPGAYNQAGGQAGQAGTGNDPCNPSGDSGCQPIQSSSPQIAAGLEQNLGMDVPSMVQGLASGLMSGSPLAGIMGQIQGAASNLLGQIGLGGIPLSPDSLTNPAGAISKLVGDKIASMGANILPSITGNLPGPLAQVSGMAQGMISDKITSTANQIFAKSSPPKLDRFISIFNAANAARSFSNDLQETTTNILNNVFGNATEVFQDKTKNNWAIHSTLSLEENPYIDLRGPDIPEVDSAVDYTITRQELIGDTQTVLENLINKPLFNAFSSMFYNWDAFVTRGYSTLTNNIIDFGKDLKGLGKLADLNDILRIGTPGQIAQQIIINGGGVTSGLSNYMQANDLMFTDLSKFENDELIAEFLENVVDVEIIDYIKQILKLDENLNFQSLGDLLKVEKIFPRSYLYNYFTNLNHIAVFLSICSGRGNITTLEELGNLIYSFEVPFDSSKIDYDPAIYSYEEITNYVNNYAPIGFFSLNGQLTIADFIGTAAGYIHEKTIPQITEIQNRLYEETEYFDDYYALLELLNDTLNGNYTTGNTVVVPNTVGYTFGTYSSLDDAVLDIIDNIEAELTSIVETIDQEGSDEIKNLLFRLDSLHNESSRQLVREHTLREKYGFKLGPSKKVDEFIGDGITKIIPLTVDIDVDQDFNVFVSGVWQSPNTYSVDANANTITLATAPNKGSIIAVNYKTDAYTGIANKMQVWEFASNLENYATQTGFGGPADFLRRVVTNDVYGQRISATLMNARNKARSEAAGLNSPNFETVNGSAPTYINYTNWTDIWTSEPTRAAEIWIQTNQDVLETSYYLIKRLKENKLRIEPEIDIIASNVTRQLIFYSNGNIAITPLMAELYNANQNNEIYLSNRSDLFINFSDDLPSDGFILGPYKEIISAITIKENMKNTIYNEPLSTSTSDYLKSINVDLSLLITIMQRVLTVSSSKYLGIEEDYFKEIFGIQSVSKYVLKNIAKNY